MHGRSPNGSARRGSSNTGAPDTCSRSNGPPRSQGSWPCCGRRAWTARLLGGGEDRLLLLTRKARLLVAEGAEHAEEQEPDHERQQDRQEDAADPAAALFGGLFREADGGDVFLTHQRKMVSSGRLVRRRRARRRDAGR